MASLVNPSNINGNFPIAGQDNDSQGFRDNFTNIRNNFTFIKNEVEDLQNKAILKTALSGGSLDNNFLGSQIKNSQLKNYSETLNDWTATSGEIQLDYALGNVHKVSTVDSISINAVIKNPPGTLQYSRILLYINITSASHTLSIPNTITTDLSSIPYLRKASGNNIIYFKVPGVYVFEFATNDAGTNYFVKDISYGNHNFRDPNFYFKNIGAGSDSSTHPSGYESPTLQIGWGNILSISDTIDSNKLGADVLSVRGAVTSYSTRALAQALSSSNFNGTATMATAGFSVAHSRIPTPLRGTEPSETAAYLTQDGDLIGYFNGLGWVKSGAGQSYQQVGAIHMYGSGTSGSGIGGNILISTKQDGVAGLYPAIGIDQNQKVTLYGDLDVKGTTTYIESTVLNIIDKNIVVAKGSTTADIASGSGLAVELTASGSYANITYVGPTDSGIGNNPTGGVFSFNRQANIEVTTASTSTTTGALVVKGGLGVAGALYVGGTFGLTSVTDATDSLTAAFTVGGGIAAVKNIISGQAIFANSTNESTTSTFTSTGSSGALVTLGGASVAKRLNVGGNVTLTSTDDTTSSTTGALRVSGGMYVAKSFIANTGPIIFGDTTNSTYTMGSLAATYNGAVRIHGGAHVGQTLNVGNDTGSGNLRILTSASGQLGTAGDLTAANYPFTVGGPSNLGSGAIYGHLNIGTDQLGILTVKNQLKGTASLNFYGSDPTAYVIDGTAGSFLNYGGSNLLGNVIIGQPTQSAGSIAGGVGFYVDPNWGSGNLYAISGAMSTGTNTGAIQIRKVKLPLLLATTNPGIYNDGFARGGMSMEGNLFAFGNVILGGEGDATAATVNSNVVVNSLREVTSSTNAALIVKGGVSITKKLYMTGNIFSASADSGRATVEFAGWFSAVRVLTVSSSPSVSGTISSGSTLSGSNVTGTAVIDTQITGVTTGITGSYVSGGASGKNTIVMTLSGGTPSPGQLVFGTNIPAGTYVDFVKVYSGSNYTVGLTQALSGQAAGTITFYTAGGAGTYNLTSGSTAQTTGSSPGVQMGGTTKEGALVLASGGAYINGTTYINGNVVFTSTGTNYGGGSQTTGALVLAGGAGAGISGKLNVGGVTTIENATAGASGTGALVLSGAGAGMSVAGNIFAQGSVQPINAIGASGVINVNGGSDWTPTAATTSALITGSIPSATFFVPASKQVFFEAFIYHDIGGATGNKSFSVAYGPSGGGSGTGAANYIVEQQAATNGAFTNANLNGNIALATVNVASITQLNMLTRISGTFTSAAAGQNVFFQVQTNTNQTIKIFGNSFVKFTRVN